MSMLVGATQYIWSKYVSWHTHDSEQNLNLAGLREPQLDDLLSCYDDL